MRVMPSFKCGAVWRGQPTFTIGTALPTTRALKTPTAAQRALRLWMK